MSDIVERDSEWPSSVDHGPFKAERHESGWWIVTNAKGSEVDDSGDGGFTEKSALWIAEAMNDKHAETILAMRKEVERLNSRLAGMSRAANEVGARLQAIARTMEVPASLATEAEQ